MTSELELHAGRRSDAGTGAITAARALLRADPVQLTTCLHCPGLLPPRAVACPHCGALVGRSSLLTRAVSAMAAAAGSGAVAMTLMACYGLPPCHEFADKDGDGFTACTDNGAPGPDNDCNDADPAIHPGAPDPLGDGIDQDCNGVDGQGGIGGQGGGGAGGKGGGGAGGKGGGGAGGAAGGGGAGGS